MGMKEAEKRNKNRTTRIENYSTKFCTYSIPTRDVEIMGFVGSKHELYKGGALNG